MKVKLKKRKYSNNKIRLFLYQVICNIFYIQGENKLQWNGF